VRQAYEAVMVFVRLVEKQIVPVVLHIRVQDCVPMTVEQTSRQKVAVRFWYMELVRFPFVFEGHTPGKSRSRIRSRMCLRRLCLGCGSIF
jgi:hypothetical protein